MCIGIKAYIKQLIVDNLDMRKNLSEWSCFFDKNWKFLSEKTTSL